MKRAVLSTFFEAPLVLAALIGIFAVCQTHVALARTRHERHISELCQLLQLALLNSQSGERAYLLTSEPEYLEQLRAGGEMTLRFRPLLQRMLVDERSKKAYSQLYNMLELGKKRCDQAILLHDKGQNQAAIAIVASTELWDCRRQIAQLLDVIRECEKGHYRLFEDLHLPPSKDPRHSDHPGGI